MPDAPPVMSASLPSSRLTMGLSLSLDRVVPEIRLPLFDERGDSLEVVRSEEPDHFQPERGLDDQVRLEARQAFVNAETARLQPACDFCG